MERLPTPLILASASPRRREILTLLGLPFEAVPAENEPAVDPLLPLDQAVCAVARGKAAEVAARFPGRTVLGADTVVSVDGLTLGKPRDEEDARRMLRLLQGRFHEVYTGVWVFGPGYPAAGCGFADRAGVRFFPLSDREIDEYVATGEPMDKAGSYGIQGRGLRNIRGIEGDFYTVMGLPGGRLWRFLNGLPEE
mgnify:FL=1